MWSRFRVRRTAWCRLGISTSVRSERAEELSGALTATGVGNSAYYRAPIHRQPAMREFGQGVALPATDEAARTHLALRMSTALTAAQARPVCAVARRQLEMVATATLFTLGGDGLPLRDPASGSDGAHHEHCALRPLRACRRCL